MDSNILLDIATDDPIWSSWSAECTEHASLMVNPIIYAEASIGLSTIEALNAALPGSIYQRAAFPWEAGFLADKSFLAYRKRGGVRSTPLPEFYIGAHAAIEKLALLTRDAGRYQTYFPRVEIFSPPSNLSR